MVTTLQALQNSRTFPIFRGTFTQVVVTYAVFNSVIHTHDTTKHWHSPNNEVGNNSFPR